MIIVIQKIKPQDMTEALSWVCVGDGDVREEGLFFFFFFFFFVSLLPRSHL